MTEFKNDEIAAIEEINVDGKVTIKTSLRVPAASPDLPLSAIPSALICSMGVYQTGHVEFSYRPIRKNGLPDESAEGVAQKIRDAVSDLNANFRYDASAASAVRR